MSLKHAGIPFATFLLVCAMFLLIQRYGMDLIQLNYDLCHFLYGLAFPLAFGYVYIPITTTTVERVPLRDLIARVRAIHFFGWPQSIIKGILRDLERGIPWSPLAGAAWIAFFSVANEVVIDPSINGIPFTSAYGNLVADLLGIGTFLVIARGLHEVDWTQARQLARCDEKPRQNAGARLAVIGGG